ncbi:MAG: PIN domain-containing protein [Saprospiraceae bacterium]
MKPLLFDTSIWVPFLRGTQNKNTVLLQEYLATGDQVFICPTIYQEILQGFKDIESALEMKSLLDSLENLELDGYFLAYQAAKIHITLRNAGYTIRKPNDCLIAFYSINYRVSLVHNDKDFDIIAKKYSLEYS